MRFCPLLFLVGFLVRLNLVNGVHLELRGKTGISDLQRRTSISGLQIALQDDQNIQYMSNITLNGQTFDVLVDTVDQHYQASVAYASGGAAGKLLLVLLCQMELVAHFRSPQGEVFSATMDFAGFTIESQYFISANSTQGFSSTNGLIGLGPYSGSVIRDLGRTPAADPPLDRIFRSNDSISNFLAVLLDRSNDPDEPYPGDLAIGEVLAGYEDVSTQPKLPVTSVMIPGNQHWMTLLDENGIIGPDGQPITIKTQVTNSSYPRNATVVFDTGFTFPQVPSYVAEALYGNVPGASLTNIAGIGEAWSLPCDQELNATFLFAGIEFPIHPLDLNFDIGNGQCAGAFQPFSFDDASGGIVMYDMVLGMAFLRNSYLLIDFGSFVDEAPPGTNAPYIQLLPITNSSQASVDFAEVRSANGTNLSTVSKNKSSTTTSTTGTSSTSTSKTPTWVIGVIIGGVVSILLLGSCIYCCLRRRRRSKLASTSTQNQPYGPQTYRPLHDPSPQGAYDMHMAPNANPGYAPQYRNAWDAHY
ncbi:hypothetical protein AZE42_04865 [Rhizopogon vesiculosus]|uniref:Peptidase A1 domain-containing protein n=1 Tax=Rhizopogon vesiculosus TaxID=180088 RepID=A0A1J8Q9R9_9AGAM|nr:hypothetical protein AZE42_04865 [Rhizopogon vesiculosus]